LGGDRGAERGGRATNKKLLVNMGTGKKKRKNLPSERCQTGWGPSTRKRGKAREANGRSKKVGRGAVWGEGR